MTQTTKTATATRNTQATKAIAATAATAAQRVRGGNGKQASNVRNTAHVANVGNAGNAVNNAVVNAFNPVNIGNIVFPSESRKMPLRQLEICQDYQRKLDMDWVNHIVTNFRSDLVSEMQVSHRDGHYYVFDGQHTKKALEMLYGGDYLVSCRIYHNMTGPQEAGMFCIYNTSKKHMSAMSLVKAQSAYGDEKVNEFLQCTRDAGFAIDATKPCRCRYGIAAVKKAKECFSVLGAEIYSLMLATLRRTWNGAHWSVSSNMLSGMMTLIRVFGNDLKVGQFISRMSRFTDDDINREAAQFYDLTLSYRFAWALATLYNRKTIKDGKEDKDALDLDRLNFVNLK